VADLVARGEAEFLIYQAEDGRTRIEVRFDGDTAWLSIVQIAELFQRDRSVILRHIGNVFEEGELERGATCARSAQVQREGDREVSREIEFYNLDVIISVGYRVKSHRGTQFRIWATQRLRESCAGSATTRRTARRSYAHWRTRVERTAGSLPPPSPS
jgi:hypothetical protein